MSIQILGLRDYIHSKTKRAAKKEQFFDKRWRVDSVDELLKCPEKILAEIPTKEHYNLYFTVADCHEESGRKLKEQHFIPFDIDNLGGTTDQEVIDNAHKAAVVACEALGVDFNKTGVIFSGHGVQLFVKIPSPICDDLYFDAAREHYKQICSRIQLRLTEAGVQGDVDVSVFSAGRLMRMPYTENRKQNKPVRTAQVLQRNVEVAEGFYLDQKSGIKAVDNVAHIDPNVLKSYPTPDTEAVLAECDFIRWQFDNPNDVKEPQWYAAASVVVRLENGVELCHRMSEGHRDYNFYEAELKFQQAEKNSGPRTCENINTLWDGCKNCKHFNKIKSPILIHGPEYIKSKDHGFREIKNTKNGPVPGKVAFEDLILQLQKELSFISIAEYREVFVFDRTHWQPLGVPFIKQWMRDKVKPSPTAGDMEEFVSRLMASNVRSKDWFERSTEGLMNFTNGILDTKSLMIVPHNKEVGFTNVLPYAYERTATCPTWDKFMTDLSDGDPKFIRLLEEYGGYSIMGGPCLADKALILLGDGANGKSVYAETLAKVVGVGNYSTVFMKELNNEQARKLLVNKLLNYSDESSVTSFADSSYFKTLVTGGEVIVKEVYKPAFMYKNKAKLLLLTNELPVNADRSSGMYRRLLIAEFSTQFLGTNADKNLRQKLWAELPGIVNRLITGYTNLVKRGYIFELPNKSEALLEKYKEESDNVLQFIRDCVLFTESEEDMVRFSDVMFEYMNWCKDNGHKPMTNIQLGMRLTKLTGKPSLLKKEEGFSNKYRTHMRLAPRGSF